MVNNLYICVVCFKISQSYIEYKTVIIFYHYLPFIDLHFEQHEQKQRNTDNKLSFIYPYGLYLIF